MEPDFGRRVSPITEMTGDKIFNSGRFNTGGIVSGLAVADNVKWNFLRQLFQSIINIRIKSSGMFRKIFP